VAETNLITPKPDFVMFGGDLAQLGTRPELDLGEYWSKLFGPQYYRFDHKGWNFWTDDAEEVQALLAPFDKVNVIDGHVHQIQYNQIGNIAFNSVMASAWPYPSTWPTTCTTTAHAPWPSTTSAATRPTTRSRTWRWKRTGLTTEPPQRREST
jgi:hypothetical protein